MKISPVADAPEMVLRNRDGNLFLRNDSNHCHEQHLGLKPIPGEVIQRWLEHFNRFIEEGKELDFEFTVLPAPDKQSVYWSTLSDQPDHRNIDLITRHLQARHIIDPLPSLLAKVDSGVKHVYPRTDTHWSATGASAALKAALDKWNLKNNLDALENRFKGVSIVGDLGRKLIPQESGPSMELEETVWRSLLKYDNHVPDNGHIRIFHNPDAPNRCRLLVVGDSFSNKLTEIASTQFEEVYHFHGGYIDRVFLGFIQPHFFIFEQTERFFSHGPRHSINSNFHRLIEEKIDAGIDLPEIANRRPRLSSKKLNSIHQTLVAAASENFLLKLSITTQPENPSGFQKLIRSIRLTF